MKNNKNKKFETVYTANMAKAVGFRVTPKAVVYMAIGGYSEDDNFFNNKKLAEKICQNLQAYCVENNCSIFPDPGKKIKFVSKSELPDLVRNLEDGIDGL